MFKKRISGTTNLGKGYLVVTTLNSQKEVNHHYQPQASVPFSRYFKISYRCPSSSPIESLKMSTSQIPRPPVITKFLDLKEESLSNKDFDIFDLDAVSVTSLV